MLPGRRDLMGVGDFVWPLQFFLKTELVASIHESEYFVKTETNTDLHFCLPEHLNHRGTAPASSYLGRGTGVGVRGRPPRRWVAPAHFAHARLLLGAWLCVRGRPWWWPTCSSCESMKKSLIRLRCSPLWAPSLSFPLKPYVSTEFLILIEPPMRGTLGHCPRSESLQSYHSWRFSGK